MHADIAAGTQVEQRVGHGLTGHLEPETPGSHRGRASTPPGSARVVGSVLGQARNAARQAACMAEARTAAVCGHCRGNSVADIERLPMGAARHAWQLQRLPN